MRPELPRNQPDRGTVLRQIYSLVNSGNYPAALQALQRLNEQQPDFAEGWYASAWVKLHIGQAREALKAISQANALATQEFPPWQLHELMCLDACGDRRPAIELGKKLANADIPDARLLASLSQILFGLQQFDLARQVTIRALELQPNTAELHLGLASIELAQGNIDATRSACERCLSLEPMNADALYFRSGLDRQTPEHNHVDELESRLEKSVSQQPAARAKIHYALAKELEDLGQHEKSFPILEQGARLYRSTLRTDNSSQVAFVDAIRKAWTSELVQASAPQPSANGRVPIFIAGLPRTGTTLVERILSAHSQVHSAGELPDFSRLVSEMVEALPESRHLDRTDMVAASTRIDLAELGRRYLARTDPVAGTGQFFIDKFPQNALYLGLIHRALPQARLILVRRQPMDACYSMYKQLFTDIYHFSYDLDELAEYYIAHHRLMTHWLDTLGESIHTVRYEDLIACQTGETRRLLNFCRLDWEQSCLEFHRNRAPSTTASASQVRNKLYSSSVGRWRKFRQHLKPLEQRLEQAGCLDYW